VVVKNGYSAKGVNKNGFLNLRVEQKGENL